MASFRFLPPAEAELLQQISYYSAIRPELGIRFEEAVANAVRSAAAFPKHGAPRSKNTRRRLVAGFPFGGIYKELEDEILVVAVADGRRKPDYWAERIDG
ncbi:MAG: type II toxin-antitoxin system RelE/ParE family toxin [Rubrivivax sp.]